MLGKDIKPNEAKICKTICDAELKDTTFDMIVLAVSNCKHKNDIAKKHKEPEPFPGIDEAYNILTEIQRRR